jgi:hypothetical protein
MRHHLISSTAVVVVFQLAMTPPPAAAESMAELSARVDLLQKQLESVREENRALRSRRGERHVLPRNR